MQIQNEPITKATVPVKPLLIAGISIFLGMAFDYLFYEKQPGISFPLFIILILTAYLFLSEYTHRKIKQSSFWLAVPLLFFSSMLAVRDSELLTFLNFITSVGLLLLMARAAVGKAIQLFDVNDYLASLFKMPFQFIHDWRTAINNFFGLSNVLKSQRGSPVIKGIIMAIPVLILFSVLFSSADLVFQQFLSDLIRFDISVETIWHIAMVSFTASFFIGAFGYVFVRQHDLQTQKTAPDKSLGLVETAVFLGLINVLFFIFLAIQATYLFGGETNISIHGFTYAEYARKGFFELILVAAITLGIILITEKKIFRQDTGHSLIFQGVSSLLALQTMVIMASSFMRLWLYEGAFGFTVLRAYSHLFVIFLAGIFCLLLVKIWTTKQEHTFAFSTFVVSLLFLTFMNVVNIDSFIARKNIERYKSSGKLDTYYLGQLSADATPETIYLLDTLSEPLKHPLAYQLYFRQQVLDKTDYWQSTNFSRLRARRLLEQRKEILEQNKDFRGQEQTNSEYSS